MQDAHCTDSSSKSDCLWRVKCNITGASCPKMDALIKKLDDTEQEEQMTNSPKATPKTATESKLVEDEKTIPAQKTAKGSEGQLDKVLDNAGKTLFSGTPAEVKAWLLEQPTKIYVVRQAKNDDLIVSTVYVEEESPKASLVQRAKQAAEKLKQNKRALAIIAGAAVVAGLAVKNSRKAVSVEPLDEAEGPINGVDEAEGIPLGNTGIVVDA